MNRNRALFLCLRAVMRLLPILPTAVLHAITSVAGTLAYFLLATPRRAILCNLAIALPASGGGYRKSLAREAFRTDAHNWVDTLRIGSLSRKSLLDMVMIEGLEHLERAVAEGKGVVVVSMHLGNFDLVGQTLVARGYSLTVPVERVDPPELFDYLMAQRQSKGVHAVPVERAAREMVRSLRAGDLVGIIADRAAAGRTVPTPYFGRPAPFPQSPIALARRRESPVLLAVGVRTGIGRFAGYISSPLPLVFSGEPDEDDALNLRVLAECMETYVLRFPGQWLAFAPIWPEASPTTEAVTIGRQNEGAG